VYSVGSQPTFRGSMAPPSSGSKRKPSKKACGKQSSCSAVEHVCAMRAVTPCPGIGQSERPRVSGSQLRMSSVHQHVHCSRACCGSNLCSRSHRRFRPSLTPIQKCIIRPTPFQFHLLGYLTTTPLDCVASGGRIDES
jgi:hypothetical protein